MRVLLLPVLALGLAACQPAAEAPATPETPATPAPPAADAADPAGDAAAHAGLMVHEPWTRPLAPGATVAAGYGLLMNHTTAPERLVAARAEGVGRIEIHTIESVDGVMQMRELEGGLELPVDGSARLAPGGKHLMFFDVTRSWGEGERIPVTLVFESGTEQVVEFAVLAQAPAGTPDAGHGGHGHHGH
jgi:copper(I)-binding protein